MNWSTLLGRARKLATRPVLDRSWDLMMYCCLAAAALSAVVCVLVPSSTDLAVFTWLMFVTSGPTATFLPSASEPILVAFGTLYSPVLLAVLGVLGIALVEWVNYRVFGAVVQTGPLTAVRNAWVTRKLTDWFATQPFLTIVVSAFTPIPFWITRVCGVMAGYPPRRFILATALGRFPRIWLIALVGTSLPFHSSTILLVGGLLVVGGAVVAATKRQTRAAARARALCGA